MGGVPAQERCAKVTAVENTALVTVIIPTLANRIGELNRAITSVYQQHGGRAVPLVVVNGDRYDPDGLADLKRREDIRLHQVAEPGVSNARLEGRRLVDTPYFMLLDDDDELLPQAVQAGLGAMEMHDADVAAFNGFAERYGKRVVFYPQFSETDPDPAMALLEENWLASAGGFFKTDRVGPELLDDLPDYLELTIFAFRLALQCKVVRVDFPAFVIHEDLSGRASQSLKYFEESPNVLRVMAAMTDRSDLRAVLHRKRSDALHHVAELMLKDGRKGPAWRYHLRSLCVGGGLRYLPFTRHILRA